MSKKLKNNKSRNLTYVPIVEAIRELILIISGAKKAFKRLRQVFIIALIFQHFDPECHIRIETDASSYAIGEVLNQLSFDWVDLDSSISLSLILANGIQWPIFLGK